MRPSPGPGCGVSVRARSSVQAARQSSKVSMGRYILVMVTRVLKFGFVEYHYPLVDLYGDDVFVLSQQEDDLVAVLAVEVFLQGHVGVLFESHQFEVAQEVDVEQGASFAFVAHQEAGFAAFGEAQGIHFGHEGVQRGLAAGVRAVVHHGFFRVVRGVAQGFAVHRRVVVVQAAVGGGDAQRVVCSGQTASVAVLQEDAEAFDVLHEVDGGQCRLVGLDGEVLHPSVPQVGQVEGALSGAGVVGVDVQVHVGQLRACCGRLVEGVGLRGCLCVVGGPCHEGVGAGVEALQVHAVVFAEGFGGAGLAGVEQLSVLSEDVEAEVFHASWEGVGKLHVVIVDKAHFHGARLHVFVDARGGVECQRCAEQQGGYLSEVTVHCFVGMLNKGCYI